ncbi:MAG: hypothetical protein JWM80_1065 [Cyanobacteria bacterium RYN_339]|nr:hypothetical protein [Cyanobacteria bacterium RYN_339]
MYRTFRSAQALALGLTILAGCQAAPPTRPTAVTWQANPAASEVRVKVDLASAWALLRGDRQLQGLGFTDTAVTKLALVAEGPGITTAITTSLTVGTSGLLPVDAQILLPAGHNRLFTLVASDANDVVLARLRAVADIPATTPVTLTFSYNGDAAGRVLDDLYHRITLGTTFSDSLSATDLTTALLAYVAHFTGFQSAGNTYSLVNPLYFKDWVVASRLNAGTLTTAGLGTNANGTGSDDVSLEYRPSLVFYPGTGTTNATVEVLDLVNRGTNGNALKLGAADQPTYHRSVAPGLVTVRVKQGADIQTFDLFVPYNATTTALDVQLPAFAAGKVATALTTTAHVDRVPAIATGKVTTVTGSDAGTANGTLANAKFTSPVSLAWNGTGLAVADGTKHIRLIKVDADDVSSLIGKPGGGVFNGVPTAPADFTFDGVNAVAFDPNGKYYTSDAPQAGIYVSAATTLSTTEYTHNRTIEAISVRSSDHWIFTTSRDADSNHVMFDRIIGSDPDQNTVDSLPNSELAPRLEGVVKGIVANDGVTTVVIGNGIYRIEGTSLQNTRTLIAGDPVASGSGTGAGLTARFTNPDGLATSADGSRIWVADTGNHQIRAIEKDPNTGKWVVSRLAGLNAGNGDGDGDAASFQAPQGLAYDGKGHLYVADTGNHRIRKIQVN